MTTTVRALGKRLLALSIPTVMLLVAPQANASVIYTYTGDNFAVATQPLTTNDHITFTFSVANPVAAPSVNFVPDTWSFGAGGFSVTSGTPGAFLSISVYAVDANNLPFVSCFAGANATISFSATIAPSPGFMIAATACPSVNSVREEVFAPGTFLAGNNNSPGTWTIQNDSTNPVPEPGTLTLLGLGLAGLGLIRRRKA